MQELFLNSLRAHIDDLGIHVNRENASTATREFPGALTKKEAAPDWEIPNSMNSQRKKASPKLTSVSAAVSHYAPTKKLPFVPPSSKASGSWTLSGGRTPPPSGGSLPHLPSFPVKGISGIWGASTKGRALPKRQALVPQS